MLPGLGHMIHHFAKPAIAEAIRELHGRAEALVGEPLPIRGLMSEPG